MKHSFKILYFFIPLLLLLSCGIINSEQEEDYDWYGEWKRTDTDADSYLVLTADKMYTFTGSLSTEQWSNCNEYFDEFSVIRKSEAAFTFSLNGDPLYVGIELLSDDLSRLVLRYEGEAETESHERIQIPDNCTLTGSETE